MQHKQTAQGLASLGRGPDTELVHMTKGEVHGLQQLAMSHGGTLTINPRTGLPEAGFLSSILPMVIGAAATYFTGGAAAALSPGLIAAMTGGGYALATGSLQKGLMAGLGAFGGAGLAGGIAEAGTAALSAETGAAALPGAANLPVPGAVESLAAATPTTAAAPAITAAPQAVNNPSAFMGDAFAANTPMPVATATPTPTTTGDFARFDRVNNPIPEYPTQGNIYSAGLKDITSSGAKAAAFASKNSGSLLGLGAYALSGGMGDGSKLNAPPSNPGMIRPYTFDRTQTTPTDALSAQYVPGQSTRERQHFVDSYSTGTPYKAPGPEYLAAGGPVEGMANANIFGQNTGYPMAYINANTTQGPQDAAVNPYTGQAQFAMGGGVSNLGGYSDGGQLLRGPGDGVSDGIPAMIGSKQQARLADGEFVIPARTVSELGNGSTEAGSKVLYAMMDRIQKARKKSIGKGNVAVDTKARNLLPA